MMTHLLDTSICVFLIRNRRSSVRRRFEAFKVGDLAISAITEAELRFGADKSADPVRNHCQLDRFFVTLPVVHFGSSAAIAYGRIRSELERAGTPIGPLDQLIAAHARSLDLTLVTNNTDEFRRIRNLKLEDWSEKGQ
ncbi:MAG: type II toxin-antitoxin system VapC family toxin [Verrucomicrobiae bacterium]|nr:type II toxin-antitoxin system VapC family toxin [Verrucomicrobiae bacterium]